jgi:hypothetical protein
MISNSLIFCIYLESFFLFLYIPNDLAFAIQSYAKLKQDKNRDHDGGGNQKFKYRPK